jgi:hypothetical protein
VVPSHNRRRFPRIDVSDGRIIVMEVGATYELRLMDISAGGFMVSSPIPYPLNATRDFVFLGRGGKWRTPLQARVVYSHARQAGFFDWPEYFSGFSFVTLDSPHVQSRIDDVIARVTDGLTFA